jgi:hypothetical protein
MPLGPFNRIDFLRGGIRRFPGEGKSGDEDVVDLQGEPAGLLLSAKISKNF